MGVIEQKKKVIRYLSMEFSLEDTDSECRTNAYLFYRDCQLSSVPHLQNRERFPASAIVVTHLLLDRFQVILPVIVADVQSSYDVQSHPSNHHDLLILG